MVTHRGPHAASSTTTRSRESRLWSEKLAAQTRLTEHRIPMIKPPKNRNSIDSNARPNAAKLQVHHETLRVLRTHELTGVVGATAAACVNPSFKCL
jgi:hypothetical protein